jgi:hypothetical protein
VQCSKVAPSAALRSCSICKTSASCRSTLSRFLLSLCRALACSTSTKRTQSRRPNIASLPHCTARKAVDLNKQLGQFSPAPSEQHYTPRCPSVVLWPPCSGVEWRVFEPTIRVWRSGTTGKQLSALQPWPTLR